LAYKPSQFVINQPTSQIWKINNSSRSSCSKKKIYDSNSISNFEKTDPIPSWFLKFELKLIVLTNQSGYPPNIGAYSLCLYQCCISVYSSVGWLFNFLITSSSYHKKVWKSKNFWFQFFYKIQNQIISDSGVLKIFKVKQHEVLIFPKHPRINNLHEITSKEPIVL